MQTFSYVCLYLQECVYIYTPWQPMSNKYILIEMYMKYMYNKTKMMNKVPGSGKWVTSFKVFTSDRNDSAQ